MVSACSLGQFLVLRWHFEDLVVVLGAWHAKQTGLWAEDTSHPLQRAINSPVSSVPAIPFWPCPAWQATRTDQHGQMPGEEMPIQSLGSQQGVLRDWTSAACSGLLLGKVPSGGIMQAVWVSVVTCVFCTRLELILVTQAMPGALPNPFLVVSLSPSSSL